MNMATKKESKVKVSKFVEAKVKRLGGRAEAEFREELEGFIAKGYSVAGIKSRPHEDDVVILLQRDQEWTVDELLGEVKSLLEAQSC